MPRPKNKQELLQQIQREYNTLKALIENLSNEDLSTQKITTNWSTKDVLAHLAEWSAMVLSWYEKGLKGERPALPREGFNWRQIPALNQLVFEEHKNDTLELVRHDFELSYKKMLSLVESLTDQELFERSHYAWTNKNNLATYLISASSSHYHWASVRVKKAFKDKVK